VLERNVILSQGSDLRIAEIRATRPKALAGKRDDVTLSGNERRHILSTHESTGWNAKGRRGAAEMLGFPPSTLASQMKKLGIKRPSKGIKRPAKPKSRGKPS